MPGAAARGASNPPRRRLPRGRLAGGGRFARSGEQVAHHRDDLLAVEMQGVTGEGAPIGAVF